VARLLSKFGRDRAGGVALVFGLVLPVLLAAVAAAVEYGLLVHRRDQLQNAADMGAIAAARELSLAALSTDGTAGLARSVILASLSTATGVSVEAQVNGASVEVTVRDTVKRYFGAVLGAPSSQLEVKAVARVASSRLCLLALEPGKRGAIDMNESARLTALQCSVFSNSKDRAGIVAADSARMDAESVCSAGGIDGKENFVRPPTTDCPQIADPLAARTPPRHRARPQANARTRFGFAKVRSLGRRHRDRNPAATGRRPWRQTAAGARERRNASSRWRPAD
jgi:hypothetical protein